MNQTIYSDDGETRRPDIVETNMVHDTLNDLIEIGDDANFPEDVKFAMLVARDTLCWVLGHDNQTFAENIKQWSDAYREQFGHNDRFDN